MWKYFGLAVAFVGAVSIAGCGSSPKEAGRAYAKAVISSLDSGSPSAIQDAAAKVQAKAQGMSPSDAANFIEGYQEVVMPWVQSKMR